MLTPRNCTLLPSVVLSSLPSAILIPNVGRPAASALRGAGVAVDAATAG
jgi:predicted Fe-Mo cluster-binding NifX family protein